MTMEAGEREALLRLMLDRAFQVGDFVLSSGAKSRYYFDGRLVTLDPLGALLIGREMAGWAREDAVAKVGGPTLGADPMVTATALCSALDDGPRVGAFIVRKEAKDHGAGGSFAGPPPEPGERVALMDDALTTGGSLLAAADKVAASGARIVAVYTLLDREEGGRERIEGAGFRLRTIFTRSDLLQQPAAASGPPA
jgi:orotate phosphoribosyltransferase